MTYSLFRLTYNVAVKLGHVIEGKATGGTTLTLVDTFLLSGYPDDLFNGGALWIIRDAGGASAAPEGEFSEVSDFAQSSSTVTVRDAFTVSPASGDFYALCDRRYPLRIIMQKINDQLQLETALVSTDKTLTTASGQTEYTLPATLMYVREVWIQGKTGDADDNLWRMLSGWYVEKVDKTNKTTLTANKLVLPASLPASYTLKVVYTTFHDYLWLNTEKLDEWVPWELVVHRAWVECLMWKKQQPDNAVADINEQLNYALDKLAKIEARVPVHVPKKTAKLLQTQDYIGVTGRYGEYLG